MNPLVRTACCLLALCLAFLAACREREDDGDRPSSRQPAWPSELRRDSVFMHGRAVFRLHCTACHWAPGEHGGCYGAMDDVLNRIPNEHYFVEFASDSRKLKDDGDAYALAVDKRWHSEYEHRFADSLTARDFDEIIYYLRHVPRKEQVVAD